MAKKNDSTELQNNAELQNNVENKAAPAETGPLVHGDANSTGTVPATSDANAVSLEGVGTVPPVDTAAQQPQEAVLLTLDALADKHRVASWQQAALLRFTGWAAGKEVSEVDYTTALNNLQYRRMGSGRA